MDIDCTKFASGATTNGCQPLNSPFVPILPGFQGVVITTNSATTTEVDVNGEPFFLIDGQESSLPQLQASSRAAVATAADLTSSQRTTLSLVVGVVVIATVTFRV